MELSAIKGLADAPGWRIGLICMSILSLLSGMFAGLLLLTVILLNPSGSTNLPIVAVLLVLIPLASLGLGLLTWRTNRVWRLASISAVAAGALGVLFAVIPAVIVLVTVHR